MALTREERLKLADIDPELAQTLKKITIPAPSPDAEPTRVIAGVRAYMKSQHKPADPNSGVIEHDIFYPARDGHQLRACVFRPVDQKEAPSPLVVYYHGGGWTIGSPEDTAPACRNLVQTLGVVCVAPSYRQGPEDPFPAGINDAWDGLKWMAAHAVSELANADASVSLSAGFVVGGSSAGGSMAAILAHLARDEKASLAAPITGYFLLSPMILPPETFKKFPANWKYKDSYLSRDQDACKQDPILSPQLEKIFHDSAAGDFESPMFVPFIWPTGHAGLPRTYFQVCGMDIVRDEDLIYEQLLREENRVETRLDIYPGMPHTFWNMFGMLTQGKKAKRDFAEGMRWLLHRPE
uniref:AB hydrolase superfamily protein B1A11.02 n=1 Tax=Talaromyces marneffei PM1 TaxID=1077442 RepID=A0A093V0H6_TALMA